MQVVKYIIGGLAVLWIIAHVVDALLSGIPSGRFASSWWTGKAVAVTLGLAVAIVCFRPAKPKQR